MKLLTHPVQTKQLNIYDTDVGEDTLAAPSGTANDARDAALAGTVALIASPHFAIRSHRFIMEETPLVKDVRNMLRARTTTPRPRLMQQLSIVTRLVRSDCNLLKNLSHDSTRACKRIATVVIYSRRQCRAHHTSGR